KIAALATLIGTVLFGIEIIRTSIYPSWTGVLLILCPVVFAVAMSRGLSPLLVIAVNLLQSLAWLTLGVLALRGADRYSAID
ncbi:MAG: hypothetical protein AAGJ52_11480, partial [Pseudomonadota bacterium]